MNTNSGLLYDKKYYKNSEYRIKFYKNGTLQIVRGTETIIFSAEEVSILWEELDDLLEEFGKEFYDTSTGNNYSIGSQIHQFEDATKQFFNIVQNISAKKSSAPDKKTLQNQLTNIYSNLYDSIQKTCQEAQKNGKKSLIVIGENHNSPNSLAIELMTSKICHELGIKNLLHEGERLVIPKFSKTNAPQDSLVLILDKEGSWNIKSIDPLNNNYDPNHNYTLKEFANKEACGWKTRAKAINDSIAKVNQSSLTLVGGAHLRHIAQDPKLNSQYQILIINSYPNKYTLELLDKVKLMEEIPDHYLDIQLKNELSKLNINSKVRQEYIEEKKSNSSNALDIIYLCFAQEVLQAVTALDENKSLKFKEIVKITLNAITYHHNKNNIEGEKYINFLNKFFNSVITLPEESAIEQVYETLMETGSRLAKYYWQVRRGSIK